MTVKLASSPEESPAPVVELLARAMSETSIETAKAQTYHWNVTGMAFGPLHDLFQQIYEDHFEAQDTLAERIKALGDHVDGRLPARLETSTIDECDGRLSARAMVKTLAADQKTLSETLLNLAHVAEEHGDDVTNDMAIERAHLHDKFAWILNAHLSE